MHIELEKNAAPTLLQLISEKDKQLLQQAEEIGRLKEQIHQMNLEKGKTASDAYTSGNANVG